MDFEEYLKDTLANDEELCKEYEALESEYELIKAMNARTCTSCFYRHRMCNYHLSENDKCKHWKIGRCYTCKFIDETDDNEWLKRGCETECFGGCKKYKRDCKKTFELLKIKFLRGELWSIQNMVK